jgi:hypothetical protein
MARYISILFLLLGSSSCNAGPSEVPESFLVNWTMKDNPTQRRIEVQYTNSFSDAVCISEGAWPRGSGYVDSMSDSMFLVVGDKRFPIESFQAGFCFGACAIRVLPGASIQATIDYQRFALPDAFRFEKKMLIYPLVGGYCIGK